MVTEKDKIDNLLKGSDNVIMRILDNMCILVNEAEKVVDINLKNQLDKMQVLAEMYKKYKME